MNNTQARVNTLNASISEGVLLMINYRNAQRFDTTQAIIDKLHTECAELRTIAPGCIAIDELGDAMSALIDAFPELTVVFTLAHERMGYDS